MGDLRSKLANEVKAKRQELNMTQEDLAEQLGKSVSYIGQLERGECLLKVETLQDLVRSLGMDANALFASGGFESDKAIELYKIANLMDFQKLEFLLKFAKILYGMDF